MSDSKPFLQWPGGKRQLMKEIERHLPPDPFTGTFIEPFVGAGSVFLHFQPPKLIINDYNSELISTYRAIRDDLPELLEILRDLSKCNTKNDFLRVRAWDQDGTLEKASQAEIAARMIYLNKTGYNGLYRVNKKGHYNVAYADNQKAIICDEPNLRAVHNYLNNNTVTILQGDYSQALAQAKKGDFVYLDPPYASEGKGFVEYTNVGFGAEDHEALRDALVALDKRGVRWLYSNASVPLIHNLFSQYKDTTSIVKATRTINVNSNKRGKVAEVLISNYNIVNQEEKTLFDLY